MPKYFDAILLDMWLFVITKAIQEICQGWYLRSLTQFKQLALEFTGRLKLMNLKHHRSVSHFLFFRWN